MDRAAILEKIIALVCDTLDAEAADVTEDTTFDDLNAAATALSIEDVKKRHQS